MKLPFWATFFTVLSVCVLCALGTWQLQRLAWKEGLIAQLDAAYATKSSEPIALYQKVAPEYEYGTVNGRFLANKAFLLGPPQMHDEQAGYDLVVPLETEAGTLLVNMGWTPYSLKAQPIYHAQGQPVSFTGLLRLPRWNTFTPLNVPEKDVWFRLDMQEVAAAKDLKDIYPAYLLADSASYKFDAAFFGDGDVRRVYPPNNHLQYAMFWFAMAGALVVVYVLRFVKRSDA
ncbi:MAG: hypothetical protein KDI46_03920 [Alphaproteobacteria bacterium]|nr:hypothetical protein [Alphaproteobacteria bacterium]